MLPWQIPAIGLDERETMESLGLLKAHPISDLSSTAPGSHFLLFPSSLDSTETGSMPCSLAAWKERESLAYYLNHHILGHGQLLQDASIPKAIGDVLRTEWVPGRHIATAPGFTGSNQGKPYIAINSIHILPLDDNRLRAIHDGDILGSRKDFVWEIYTQSINGVLYLQGQSIWITWFKKALLPKWRKLAIEVQKACSLQLIDIWHRDAPSPDMVWIRFH
jgi:hypothetical protein